MMNKKMMFTKRVDVFIKERNKTKRSKKEDAHINIKKIVDAPHLISNIRKNWSISLFIIDNEPVMIYTRWQDYKN